MRHTINLGLHNLSRQQSVESQHVWAWICFIRAKKGHFNKSSLISDREKNICIWVKEHHLGVMLVSLPTVWYRCRLYASISIQKLPFRTMTASTPVQNTASWKNSTHSQSISLLTYQWLFELKYNNMAAYLTLGIRNYSTIFS